MEQPVHEIKWTDIWTVYVLAGQLAVTVFIAFMANRWAMKYWRRQKKEEIEFQLHGLKAQGYLDAAKAVWGLLAYLTEKENGKCLLNYKGTKDKPEVYFNLERGRDYINKLSEVFFDQGHGIFLTKELKQEIFHIRTHVYSIIDKENRRGILQGEVLLENQHMIDFFREHNDKLRIMVRQYILKELKYNFEDE